LIKARTRFFILVFDLVFVALFLSACCGGNNEMSLPTARDFTTETETVIPTIMPPPTLAPDAIVAGQQVYVQHCARCHGDDLEGQANWKEQNEDGSFRAPPHDADGHTWHHSDKLLIEAIEQGGARLPTNIGGTSNMPAFANVLKDEEITAVLDYIKSTWPDDIRAIQWEQTIREQP